MEVGLVLAIGHAQASLSDETTEWHGLGQLCGTPLLDQSDLFDGLLDRHIVID